MTYTEKGMTATGEAKNEIWKVLIETRDGEFLAHYSSAGLCGLDFPCGEGRKKETANSASLPSEVNHWHKEAITALENALAGLAVNELPPLDLSAGTDFQQRVWRVLKSIACGKTLSYGEVAD